MTFSDVASPSSDSKPEYSRPFHQIEWCRCAVIDRSRSQLNIGSPKIARMLLNQPECAFEILLMKLIHTKTASAAAHSANAGCRNNAISSASSNRPHITPNSVAR